MRLNHHYFIYSRALAFTYRQIGCTSDFVIVRLGNAFALSPLSRAALDQGSALDFGYELDYVV